MPVDLSGPRDVASPGFDHEVESLPHHDAAQESAVEALATLFDAHRDRVFYGKQLEVLFERKYFHWVTNRAYRELIDRGRVRQEIRSLTSGVGVRIMWDRRYRYAQRAIGRLVALIEEYSRPEFSRALGHNGELLVGAAFADRQFVQRGRESRSYAESTWTETEHDLDFIFDRDEVAYGVEVKNTLGYMDQDEFRLKRRLCEAIGVRPVFAVRMLPKTWINELRTAGGYAIILEWQLYPLSHLALARQVHAELGIPVDAPGALFAGTMDKFERWHERQVT